MNSNDVSALLIAMGLWLVVALYALVGLIEGVV